MVRDMPPAGTVGRSYDWAMVEMTLSTAIPEDYRTFIATWGPGTLGGFVHLFAPHVLNKTVRLPSGAQTFNESYATLKSGHPDRFPLPISPNTGGLLPFAITDNGDYLGWIVDTAAPAEDWPVAVLAHGEGTPQHFDEGFGPFMASFVAGDFRPKAFPGDLYEDLPLNFEPYSR